MRYGIGFFGALSFVATAWGCDGGTDSDDSAAGNSGSGGGAISAGTAGAATAAGRGGTAGTGGDFGVGGAQTGGGLGGTGGSGGSGFGGGGLAGVAGGNAGAATAGTGGGAGGRGGVGGASGRGGTNGGGGATGGTDAGAAGSAGSAGVGGAAVVGGAAGVGGTTGGAGPVTYDFLLTAFTNESESNMYVYRSDNGRNFELVKGPAYTPPGSQLVRDPSVMLRDGRYYIVYTTGWRENEFGIATSTDLQTWTFLTTVPTLSNATSSWAPEWFIEDGAFHVVISLSTTGNGSNYGNFTPHLFTALSDDLMTWDGGVQMDGIEPNYIDTFVVRSGDTYHAFTKNENAKLIEHATASALAGPYTFVGTGNWAGWGSTAVEGPCLFQLANGTWRMLVDGYTSSQYLYSDSEDLVEWSPRQTLPGGLSGFIRHGTVLRRVVEP